MGQSDSDIVTELEETSRLYITKYSAGLWRYVTEGTMIDYGALGFWRFPMMYVLGEQPCGDVKILDNRIMDEMNREIYKQYYADGWCGQSAIDTLKAVAVSSNLGIVEMDGTRYRADRSVNSRWSCLYLLERTSGSWKQFLVDAAEPRRSASDWARWLQPQRSPDA